MNFVQSMISIAEIKIPALINKLKMIPTIHGAYSFDPTDFPSTEFIIFE